MVVGAMPSREAVTRSISSWTALRAGLLIGGHIFQFGQLLQLRHEFVGPLVQFVGVGIFERVLILRAADAVVHRDVLHRLHVEVHAVHLAQACSAGGGSRRRR